MNVVCGEHDVLMVLTYVGHGKTIYVCPKCEEEQKAKFAHLPFAQFNPTLR